MALLYQLSGDIFKATGWKLIPCTEYYDTIVDDIVIAKSSLNGLFIQNCVANLPELNERISGEKELLFLILNCQAV